MHLLALPADILRLFIKKYLSDAGGDRLALQFTCRRLRAMLPATYAHCNAKQMYRRAARANHVGMLEHVLRVTAVEPRGAFGGGFCYAAARTMPVHHTCAWLQQHMQRTALGWLLVHAAVIRSDCLSVLRRRQAHGWLAWLETLPSHLKCRNHLYALDTQAYAVARGYTNQYYMPLYAQFY